MATLLLVGLLVVVFVRARRAERLAEEALTRISDLQEQVARLTASHATSPPATAADPITAPRERAAAIPPRVIHTPPPQSALTVVPRVDAATGAAGEGLEQRIGGRWLLYVGIAAVILGISYFVKFAFDNGWVSEPLRVLAGLAAGALLVGAGWRLTSRGLPLFGQVLAGGGIVVLYVALYAALHFYSLIDATPAFLAMMAVTGLAGWLADRQRAEPLAMLALVGGFATPLLVGGERGSQVILFTYVAVLATAAVLLARRRRWPLLSAASYVGTFLIVVIWMFASYEAGAWLRTHLFLTAYVALFGYALSATVRGGDRSPQAALSTAALVTAPLSYHMASMLLLVAHPAAWLLYVSLATLVAVAISHSTGLVSLRLLALVLVGIPAAAWLTALEQERWYAAAVVTMVVLYGLHLIVAWHAAKDPDGQLSLPEAAHIQFNGLLLPAALYAFIETRFAHWNPWMTGGLAIWNLTVLLLARRHAPPLAVHHTALSATLFAATVVLAFDGPAVAVGWAAEGVFLAWIALRERSRAIGAMGAALILLGVSQLTAVLVQPLPVNAQPVFNARTLAAMLTVALLAFLASRMTRDVDAEVRGSARNAAIVLANLLVIGVLSAEVLAVFDQRAYAATSVGEGLAAARALQAGQVVLSVTWALYAVGLIGAGIQRTYAPARVLGIALFGVTLLKVLAWDIAQLGRVERMLTVLGVGVLLLAASYLYQRFASRRADARGAADGAATEVQSH